MKYENAKNVLPQELLAELQRYVEGTCLYIPALQHRTKQKFAVSNQKRLQLQRNVRIIDEYNKGTSVIQLSQQFYLSKQAIYKILKSSND